MSIVVAKDLWKSFQVRGKRVEAVRGLSLTVEEGEVFGFLGPNGAGKTTTLRLLTTMLTPDRGEVLVAGYDVCCQPLRVREYIGYVGQAGSSDIMASGRANIILQGRAYGMSNETARARAQELCGTLDLLECADRPVVTYSGGQRRRLDLALGMVHRPRLLFLDEPGTALDPQSRARLWNEIRQIQQSGTTVFLTTHYLDEADALCNRLGIIDHGQIVATGTPGELKQRISGDMLTLTPGAGAETSAQTRALLETQPYIRSIQPAGTTMHISVEQGERDLLAVLRLLEGAGLAVQSVTLARPSLDDVFLQLTGRSLRD